MPEELEEYIKKEKIKRSRRFSIVVDDKKQNLLAFKKKGKLHVVNAETLRTEIITTKFNLNNVEHGFRKKQKEVKFGKKKFLKKVSELNLEELERVPFKTSFFVRRSHWLSRKVGKIYISVTFVGKRGKRQITEGGSRSLKLLTDSGERARAFNEAFKGALSKINFSYDHFIINWIHYAYSIPKPR